MVRELSRDQRQRSFCDLPQGPPSFRVAAGHLSPGELRAFLTHPHGQMPDFSLTRSEIDDLIAYIEAVR